MASVPHADPLPRRRMLLTREEADAIERRIASVEARTGIEVVAAVIARADSYPELPWKAFALGASLAALALVAVDLARPDWIDATAALLCAAAILAVGAAGAALVTLVPAAARALLPGERADAEVRQHAQSMFVARDLVDTPGRDAVLILASVLERRVVVLPDRGLASRVAASQWAVVVDAMRSPLRDGRVGLAFDRGLAALEAILPVRPGDAAAPPRFDDRPIEEA